MKDRTAPNKPLGLIHAGDESHLLREVMRTHQALLNVFSREVGMPAARLALLRLLAIAHPEGIGVMEMARRLGVNAAAITRQVKAMEATRLVVRRADAKDKRRSWVKFTAKGLRTFEQIHQRAHVFERSLNAVAGEEEIAAATQVLLKVRTAIEEHR